MFVLQLGYDYYEPQDLSLGLTLSHLVEYIQLVRKILIQGYGCYELFTMGRSDRCEESGAQFNTLI